MSQFLLVASNLVNYKDHAPGVRFLYGHPFKDGFHDILLQVGIGFLVQYLADQLDKEQSQEIRESDQIENTFDEFLLQRILGFREEPKQQLIDLFLILLVVVNLLDFFGLVGDCETSI